MKDIEDEIPFDLPEGWAWCRLPNISASIFAGGDRPIIYEKTKSDKCNIPIYSNGIENNGLYGFTDKSVVNVSSLTISARGTIGFSCIRNEPFVPIIRLITIIPFIECINLVFLKFSFDALFSFSEGSSIPQLTVPTVKQFLLPLPPLSEQQRIVAKIETIFAEIDLMEQNKADLQTAVKQAKSKILDLAIRGKLVPQDPADEPASVMLERLRAEKEAKIASSEIKRGKNDSYIYKNSTDNCYYEKFDDGTEKAVEMFSAIPESWIWCHLGDVVDVINGKNQSQVEDNVGEYPIYGSGGIMGYANDYICPENCTIIGRKGSINNPIFVEEKLWNVDTAFGLAPSSIVLPRYLFYFCKSFDFTSLDSSTTLPSLTKTSIQRILFPLPPLAAQKQILDKIDELFSQLDKISLNIV